MVILPRRNIILLLITAIAVIFAMLPLTSASAESVGITPPPPSGGGSGSGKGIYACGTLENSNVAGPALWMKGAYDNNGVYQTGWVLLLDASPFCGGGVFPIRNPDTSTITYLDCPTGKKCEGKPKYERRWDCTEYFEVYRFYGPPNAPTRYMSAAAADAVTPCQLGENYRFFTPNPRDAGVSPGAPFSTTWRYTTAQRTISSQGCPVPDDNGNLEEFFATDWPTPEQADLATQFRKAFGDAYRETAARTSRTTPPLPRSVNDSFFNARGLTTYPGDTFTSVRYPDNVPCSSGLDFAVRSDSTSAPWVFGICFVPVVTKYNAYLLTSGPNSGTRIFSKRDKLSSGELGIYPYYDASWAATQVAAAPRDAITNAYRTRLRSSLGRDAQGIFPQVYGAAAVANDVPCYWGQGAVIDQVDTTRDLEPVDPPVIAGPPDRLAYVGGRATSQQFSYAPLPLTCTGGNRCTQGQTMVAVNYAPTLSVPPGWTECTNRNRASCDYRIDYTQRGFRLDVDLETYTATRPGQAISFTASASVVVEYPGPESQTWLTIDLPRTWAWQDVGLSRIDISSSNLPDNRVTLSAVALPTNIQVAGSRLTTSR